MSAHRLVIEHLRLYLWAGDGETARFGVWRVLSVAWLKRR